MRKASDDLVLKLFVDFIFIFISVLQVQLFDLSNVKHGNVNRTETSNNDDNNDDNDGNDDEFGDNESDNDSESINSDDDDDDKQSSSSSS